MPDEPGCDKCRPFQEIFDEVQAANAEYELLYKRRDTYRPKIDALSNRTRARIALENFLIEIDGWISKAGKPVSTQHEDVEAAEDCQQQPIAEGSKPDLSLPAVCLPSPPGRLSQNQKSYPTQKHLRFSKSVEFRDQYRTSNQYARSGETYVPGRYAAPDGQKYVDTSGHSQSFLKFTGYRRVGNQWIDIWEDEDEQAPPKAGKNKAETSKTSSNEESKQTSEISSRSDSIETLLQADPALMDARTLRLARRRNLVSDPVSRSSKSSGKGHATGSKQSKSGRASGRSDVLDTVAAASGSNTSKQKTSVTAMIPEEQSTDHQDGMSLIEAFENLRIHDDVAHDEDAGTQTSHGDIDVRGLTQAQGELDLRDHLPGPQAGIVANDNHQTTINETSPQRQSDKEVHVAERSGDNDDHCATLDNQASTSLQGDQEPEIHTISTSSISQTSKMSTKQDPNPTPPRNSPTQDHQPTH